MAKANRYHPKPEAGPSTDPERGDRDTIATGRRPKQAGHVLVFTFGLAPPTSRVSLAAGRDVASVCDWDCGGGLGKMGLSPGGSLGLGGRWLRGLHQ